MIYPASPSRSTDGIDDLLRQVAGGNRAAFERLYHDSAPILLGVCMRVLPDRSEAEDVLQEAFVAIWTKAAQFDGVRARGLTWMGAIARHRAIDRLRGMPRGTRLPVEAIDEVADPEPSAETHAEASASRARLDDCVEQLDRRRKHLIRIAFFEGVTYEELAARTGSPLGSIKSWIRRGLQQLRACLEQ